MAPDFTFTGEGMQNQFENQDFVTFFGGGPLLLALSGCGLGWDSVWPVQFFSSTVPPRLSLSFFCLPRFLPYCVSIFLDFPC